MRKSIVVTAAAMFGAAAAAAPSPAVAKPKLSDITSPPVKQLADERTSPFAEPAPAHCVD